MCANISAFVKVPFKVDYLNIYSEVAIIFYDNVTLPHSVVQQLLLHQLKHGYSTGAILPPLGDFNQKRGDFNDF